MRRSQPPQKQTVYLHFALQAHFSCCCCCFFFKLKSCTVVYINFFCKSVNFSSFSCISELLCEDGEDKKGWKVVSSIVDKHELTGVFSFFFFFFFLWFFSFYFDVCKIVVRSNGDECETKRQALALMILIYTGDTRSHANKANAQKKRKKIHRTVAVLKLRLHRRSEKPLRSPLPFSFPRSLLRW